MGRKPKYSKEVKIKACKDYEIGILKSEMFYGKKFKSLEKLIEKIVEYIKFYNEKRFQKRLGCMAPLEYRNHASIGA